MKTARQVQVVLLCSEEDDLELVQLVHQARQRGIELEVVSGVEADVRPYHDALAATPEGLFVMLLSKHLGQERALELDAIFERARTPRQHMMVRRLDVEHPMRTLAEINARVRRLSGQPLDPSLEPPPPPPPKAGSAADEPASERRSRRFLGGLLSLG